MDEERIKEIVQQMIDQNATANQFAVSDTPFHTHNGSDSQSLKFTRMYDVPTSYFQQAGKVLAANSSETALEFTPGPATIYVGEITASGTATHLPTGWTCGRGAQGIFNVAHNLGHTNYEVISNEIGISAYYTNIYNKAAASFTIGVFDALGAPQDADTGFIMVLY